MNLSARFGAFRHSFLFRLVARFTLVSAAVVLLVCSLYILSEIREDRRYAEEKARLAATALAESARLPLFSGNREELSRLARSVVGSVEIRRAVVIDRSGRTVAEAGRPHDPDTSAFAAAVLPGPPGTSPESVLAGEAPRREGSIGTVRIEYAATPLSERVRDAAVLAGIASLLFLSLVSALSFSVLRSAMRSFDGLLAGLGAIREGRYDVALPSDPGTEIGIAAANVNGLAEALARREEENRSLQESLEREIREHAAAEAEAREGERTLRDLMDAMPAGVVWTDPEGSVQFMNRCALEIFGCGEGELATADDLLSLAVADPAWRRRLLEARSAAVGGSGAPTTAATYEGRIARQDGSSRHVLFTDIVRKGRIVTTLVDVTERDAMQERMLRAQKMETLGVLAGGIAHNFNNALTAVLGYVGYARQRLDDPAKADELLKTAEEAGVAATRIAGQLLTFARGGEPVKAPLSLADVVESAVSLSLVGSRVDASVEVAPDLHGVEADEGQIGQVLNNLLLNAVQAMPEGGKVVVRCGNADPAEPIPPGLPPGRYVKISVSDHGCGIPAELLGKIFDPYFTTKADVGRGLGLASVRSIVERHGGAVSVRSEVGRGTTFTLHLPSTGEPPPGERRSRERPVPTEMGEISVLFLDDEAPIRNLVRETLEHFGCRVTTCARGEEAILLYQEARAHGRPFSATILDLTIPNGMGGRETAERILALDPEAVLVVTSGYSNDPVMADHGRFGFRAAVPKPYRDNALARALGTLFAGKVGDA